MNKKIKALFLSIENGIYYLKKEIKFINKNYGFCSSIVRKLSFFNHILYWQIIFKIHRKIGLKIRKENNLPFFIHKNKLEIEITSDCNLKCYQCDRSCRQAYSNENMSIEQIEYFIKESVKAKKKWPFIVLIGGEPTLHPEIFRICELFIEYKLNFSPNAKLTIITNGVGPYVKNVLSKLPYIIHQENSEKKTTENVLFDTYNVAPVDIKKYQRSKIDFTRGCHITTLSGIALTRYGFYCCGAGASIDRVFGMDIGLKNINEITEENLRDQLKFLCRTCGHFKDKKDDIYDLKTISPTWQDAYAEYKENKPILKLYGTGSKKILKHKIKQKPVI